MADNPMEASSLATTGGRPPRKAKRNVSYVSEYDNNGNAKKNRESGTKKSGVVLSTTTTTVSSFVDGARAEAGAGAELTTSTTVFDFSKLTIEKLDEAIMALEGTFDPIPSTGGCQYVGVRSHRGCITFSVQIGVYGEKKMEKSGFKTAKEAGIWYVKAKYVKENCRAIESKPFDPKSKIGQRNNAKKGVVINPDDYSIVTTLSLLEDPNYKHKHENHTQGLLYDQLRDTDVLLGNSTLATEDDATMAFRKEVMEKFGNKPISITNPDLIDYVNELFNIRKVRLMEEYIDDDGNNVWGSHGGVHKITRYIIEYVKGTSKRMKSKNRKKDFDESEEEDEYEDDDE